MSNVISSALVRRLFASPKTIDMNSVVEMNCNITLSFNFTNDNNNITSHDSFNYYIIGVNETSDDNIKNENVVLLGYDTDLLDDPDYSGEMEDPYGIITTDDSSNVTMRGLRAFVGGSNTDIDSGSYKKIDINSIIFPNDKIDEFNKTQYNLITNPIENSLYFTGEHLSNTDGTVNNIWNGIRRKYIVEGNSNLNYGSPTAFNINFIDEPNNTVYYYLLLNFFTKDFQSQTFSLIRIGGQNESINLQKVFSYKDKIKTRLSFLPIDIDSMATFSKDNYCSNLQVMKNWGSYIRKLDNKIKSESDNISKKGF